MFVPPDLARQFNWKTQRRCLQRCTAESEIGEPKQVLADRLSRLDESARPRSPPVARAHRHHPRRRYPMLIRDGVDGVKLSRQLRALPFVVVIEKRDHRATRGVDSELPTAG